jgi:hypothetical protein
VSEPREATVIALGLEAGLRADEVLHRLQELGFSVKHNRAKLAGTELRRAREALGLRGRGPKPQARPTTDEPALMLRLLRPLRQKGKLGRNHTTEVDNVCTHGIDDHDKRRARDLVEAWLTAGVLAEKPSCGRRHVWLTMAGLALLERLEAEGTGTG